MPKKRGNGEGSIRKEWMEDGRLGILKIESWIRLREEDRSPEK